MCCLPVFSAATAGGAAAMDVKLEDGLYLTRNASFSMMLIIMYEWIGCMGFCMEKSVNL